MDWLHRPILIIVCLASLVAWGRQVPDVSVPGKSIAPEWMTPSLAGQIGFRFLSSHGELDLSSLRLFRSELEKRREEIRVNLERNLTFLEEKSEKKVDEKIRINKTLKHYDIILEWIDQLATNPRLSFAERVGLIRNITDLDAAVKSDIDPDNTLEQKLKHLQAFSHRYRISKNKTPLGEAANLVNPKTGLYFSPQELETMKAEGIDLSLFDPPANNGVLELIDDLSKTSPTQRFSLGQNPLHRGVELYYPADNKLYFKEVRHRQSKPKLTVFSKKPDGEKQEFKLKLAMELHGEPTSAALSNALGIYSDLTRYVRGVKLVLGKTTYEEFKKDWNSYYSSYDLDRLIQKKGSDQEGNFVVFIDGLLEPELDEKVLKRAGPWYWGDGDHKYRREFRGMAIFNLWIHNTDLKEGENNKLILKKRADGEHDFFYVQQDLGFSFGHLFRERPSDYPWDIVSHDNSEEVIFNYRSFQPNSGFEHVTWADARWMVRKIAQLTREQITEAVGIGNWPHQAPYDYQALYVEKLISRRNQLVQVFGLDGAQNPSGKRIALMEVDRRVEERAIVSEKWGVPGYTVDFSPGIQARLIDPLMAKIQRGLKDGAIKLIGAINNVSLEPDWFGWDEGVIARVILNINRTVVKNPMATSSEDAFIVRDDFKIGARLGYGLVISGDVAYVRGFSLIYPAASEEAAMDGPRYMLEVITESYSQMQDRLPKGHILIHESYLEGRGRLNLDAGPISVGYEASLSRFDLSRTLISRKSDDRILLMEDESLYTERAQKIYTKLMLLKITHMKWHDQRGEVNRDAYELGIEDGQYVDDVIFANDFSEIKKRGQHKKMKSEFWERVSNINLLGFWKKKKTIRRDLVQVSRQDERGKWQRGRTKLIVDVGAQQAWRFVQDGEDHIKRIHFSSELNGNEPVDPLMKLSFVHMDKNATISELESGYLPFIDGVAGVMDFLNFSPRLHAKQDGYGEILVNTHVEYYGEAIGRLFELEESAFKGLLNSQIEGRKMVTVSSGESDKEEEHTLYRGKWYSSNSINYAVDRFFRYYKDVVGASNFTEQVEALNIALYKGAVRDEASFHPVVFGVLNQWVGEDNVFLESHISVPEDVENKFPGRVTFYNRIGEQKKFSKERDRLLFDLSEALAIYQAF